MVRALSSHQGGLGSNPKLGFTLIKILIDFHVNMWSEKENG